MTFGYGEWQNLAVKLQTFAAAVLNPAVMRHILHPVTVSGGDHLAGLLMIRAFH